NGSVQRAARRGHAPSRRRPQRPAGCRSQGGGRARGGGARRPCGGAVPAPAARPQALVAARRQRGAQRSGPHAGRGAARAAGGRRVRATGRAGAPGREETGRGRAVDPGGGGGARPRAPRPRRAPRRRRAFDFERIRRRPQPRAADGGQRAQDRGAAADRAARASRPARPTAHRRPARQPPRRAPARAFGRALRSSTVRSGIPAFVTLLAAVVSSGCGEGRHRLGGAVQRQQQNTGGTWGGAAGSGSAWLDPVLERPCGLCSEGAYCEMIDDMEDDGDSAIMFINGRSGNWYAFNDKTSSAQVPESDADYFTMVDLDPPRGRSLRAAWTKGEGFTDWGAGIGFDLRAKTPYDASQYAGVTFVGMSHEPRDMRFDIGDATTVPQAPICEGEQYCYDNFGRAVQLGTDW